ncbi:2,3-bisphosphoglycerate-independent phosphoglycerate mutase [Candidatus Methylopumilus turicensis]|uniref:2,3-bisphosphoglycerate-independent phosphoglycerate mutase n=1 Tax=Candidatus Methylopumilus turicensis TaxID=1581680 RepID=A0A0B7IWH0_9PROT|nr:2,3-bisphosphoglycerate-independent phosphoglycerate mutase [Candidatus Methylopumilus turicensis]CEN55432.1 phosphoglycero mutase III, cofactor-independent [Candidatus Methylopumilus turicensis]
MKITPVVLLILDGFGYREDITDNAIAQANKPNWDRLWQQYPHTLINASEHFVGLPDGQMGNSEVGHLNIGAGRIVFQEFERINHAIKTGQFGQNPVLLEAVNQAKNTDKALHIFGLISDGGVHSHQDHIYAMIRMAAKQGLNKIYIHAFLDGRDTPPVSAKPYLQALEDQIKMIGAGKIASICGRYYAMDRDKRWERVEPAYRLLTEGTGEFKANSALEALEAAYKRGENDEFVKATSIANEGEVPAFVDDGDVIVFMNFRSDRARQMTACFLDASFEGFKRQKLPTLGGYYTLTMYDKNEVNAKTVFAPNDIHNTFGEYIANQGLKQLRIAETEKYPHVTFFFNGGEEKVFEGESRILVPSPKVATYDLQPEMSAFELTDQLEAAVLSNAYAAIICNYANCDMVGHTGFMPAAIKAIEAIDTCIGRVVKAALSVGAEVIITADHGNVEMMQDLANDQPHTQHTTNVVPLLYIGRDAEMAKTGALSDIAPSLLCMMGLSQPAEMTGHSLVKIK